MKNQKGFTLLELLVVIGIIGILVAMGTVSYSSAQRRGRDARRRADVEAVNRALEQYYAENAGSYPTSGDCAGFDAYFAGEAPTDPKLGGSYVVTGSCLVSGSSYCVCATMEVTGTGNTDTDSSATGTCTWSSGASKDYFCVGSLQ